MNTLMNKYFEKEGKQPDFSKFKIKDLEDLDLALKKLLINYLIRKSKNKINGNSTVSDFILFVNETKDILLDKRMDEKQRDAILYYFGSNGIKDDYYGQHHWRKEYLLVFRGLTHEFLLQCGYQYKIEADKQTHLYMGENLPPYPKKGDDGKFNIEYSSSTFLEYVLFKKVKFENYEDGKKDGRKELIKDLKNLLDID